MEFGRDVLVSPAQEVLVLDGEVVTAIRTLADRGAGIYPGVSSARPGRWCGSIDTAAKIRSERRHECTPTLAYHRMAVASRWNFGIKNATFGSGILRDGR